MTQTDSLFAQALAHHEAGRGNDAEPLYLAVLAESPTHPHALHNLGQLWLGRGEPARALSYLRRALELVPEDGLFWVSCLEALLHDERYPEASELLARGRAQGLAGEVVEQLAQALDFARDLPRHDAAIVACFQQGDDLQLAECARAVLAQCPGHGFAWKALGVALIRLGQFSEAMQALDMAQRRLPDDASVFNSLTNVLNSLGRHEEAEVAGRRALALQADYPQALVNLGNALRGMACLEEAERYYRQAMRTPACQIEAGNNLGIVLEEQGRLDEAESCLRDVLEHDPDYAPAWNHLGCVLDEQGRHEAALQAFQRCLSLDPDNVMAYNNLACTLKSLQRFTEAEQALSHALQLAPSDYEALNNLGDLLKELGRTETASEAFWQAWQVDVSRPTALHNLLVLAQYVEHISDAERISLSRAFARQYEPEVKSWEAWPPLNDPERPLRLGWVSADLRNHSVAYFSLPVIEGLVGKFEQYVYYNSHDHDPIQVRHQHACTVWRDVAGWSDHALATQIGTDQIDILIDLSGHTARNRLLTFARGAAPVQVTWLGYPDTTGLHNMHWRITDARGDPEGAQAKYSERLWYLPDVFCCYRPMLRHPAQRLAAEYAVRQTPALTTGQITLGCCNNLTKLTPGVIRVWARVLLAIPGSRLLLELAGAQHELLCHALLNAFSSHGVNPDRVCLLPRDSTRQYLTYHDIDIALDPFPANGGASSCDTLWMGVPLVTLAGQRFASRMGCSLLHAVGHPEWVATSEDEYVKIVVELARDLHSLNALRLGLRTQVEASPLMDEARFCLDFTSALRGMWRQACIERVSVSR